MSEALIEDGWVPPDGPLVADDVAFEAVPADWAVVPGGDEVAA
ncbi:MAG: hypothetical protein ABR571_02330 [Jatrophihabitans sp.]